MYKKYMQVPVDDVYRRSPVFAKQHDYNSRYFCVSLVENGRELPADTFVNFLKVAIGITRGDGQRKAYEGEYDSENNTFILPLPSWAVENAGELKCDIMVWQKSSETELLRSATFEVYVQPSNYNGEEFSDNANVNDFLISFDEDIKELADVIDDIKDGTTAVGVAKKVENPLTFTGVKKQTYDGSSPLTIGSINNPIYKAVKAEEDGDGNVISTTYATKDELDDIKDGTTAVGKVAKPLKLGLIGLNGQKVECKIEPYDGSEELEIGTKDFPVFYANYASYDSNGNSISTTYATKRELDASTGVAYHFDLKLEHPDDVLNTGEGSLSDVNFDDLVDFLVTMISNGNSPSISYSIWNNTNPDVVGEGISGQAKFHNRIVGSRNVACLYFDYIFYDHFGSITIQLTGDNERAITFDTPYRNIISFVDGATLSLAIR